MELQRAALECSSSADYGMPSSQTGVVISMLFRLTIPIFTGLCISTAMPAQAQQATHREDAIVNTGKNGATVIGPGRDSMAGAGPQRTHDFPDVQLPLKRENTTVTHATDKDRK